MVFNALRVIEIADSFEPSMLLWGAAVPRNDQRAVLLRSALADVSARIGELPSGRSEPDVTLDFGPEGIVIIEVKHRSLNEVNVNGSWARYLSDECFTDVQLARESGLYELTRNWRIAYSLAGARPFAVLNLGPNRLFSSSQLKMFMRSLGAADQGRLLTLSWERFGSIAELREDVLLSSFLANRAVVRQFHNHEMQ